MVLRIPLGRTVIQTSAVLLAATPIFLPSTRVHAEAPESPAKKPIYDELPTLSSPSKESSSKSKDAIRPESPSPNSPTATELLAGQIRRARLFLYAHTALAEDKINDVMTSFLDLETSFTNTVASLAPPRESGERVLPGGIYVLVSALAGSIVTRNRGLLLRSAVPVAVGIGASWVLLPITTRNVADLAWKYEQRVPIISNNHMRIRGATEEGWRIARAKSQAALAAVDDKVQGGRVAVEEWVKKG
ncbi:MAG: hypothetical protein M1825_001725 [Sarcosagium campestre]|nr:MAG: hypothetical protein M1825_001725 [Sarcosagium campestre]